MAEPAAPRRRRSDDMPVDGSGLDIGFVGPHMLKEKPAAQDAATSRHQSDQQGEFLRRKFHALAARYDATRRDDYLARTRRETVPRRFAGGLPFPGVPAVLFGTAVLEPLVKRVVEDEA